MSANSKAARSTQRSPLRPSTRTDCPSATTKEPGPAQISVEVRPGEGGTDAEAFAAEIIAALCAHLRRTENSYHLEGRDRTTVIVVDHPDHQVSALAGTHRIQRIPKNDPRGRRHTSTATVAILDGLGVSRDPVELPEHEVMIEAFSGSGAGGQYRNRHLLCVRARHLPTRTVVVSTRHRSLEQNAAAAVAELARRVHDNEVRAVVAERNERRRAQVASERSAKQWTWNDQRTEVLDHSTGRTWPLRLMMRGKFPPRP